MSTKDDMIVLEGVVTDTHKGALFSVDCEYSEGKTIQVLARPAGRLKKNNIKIILGDRVQVEISPFDLTKGRIKYRLK